MWYKIQNDPNLDKNLDYIGDSTSNPRVEYNWEGYVYVEAKYFTIISDPEDYTPGDVTVVGDDNETPKKTVNNVIKDASYKYNDGVISGIKLGTKVKDLIDKLVKTGATNITVTDINGKNKKSDIIATGDKLNINIEGKDNVVNVVIFGDINGDGVISASDYVKIKNHIMDSQKLTGVYEAAADYDNNNSISASDYVKIKNYIMGK